MARRFAREGFAVALMARSEGSVAGVREEIEGSGSTAFAVTADATEPASVASAFERVRDELGDPEVFVCNAGAFEMGGVLEIPPQRFDECFRANCAGGFLTGRAAARVEGSNRPGSYGAPALAEFTEDSSGIHSAFIA